LDDIHPMGKPLDGVIVSTPTSTHPNIIRQASDAQVAVFTEKPVGETAQDIEATFRYASNIAVCCGFQRRFDPAYVAAKQNLHLVGKPVFAHIFFADHPGPPKEFLLEGGNIFMDLSAHDVDYITDALSQHVVSVYATGTSSDPDLEAAGVHDSATCVLHLSQGKFLKPRTPSMLASFLIPSKFCLLIQQGPL
jgi:predicted dehydrogenase